MALYQPKLVKTVEAFPLASGDGYVVINDGVGSIVPKAEFEAQYVPFVQPPG